MISASGKTAILDFKKLQTWRIQAMATTHVQFGALI